MNYYNENDPQAAEWLRELIARGAIAEGYVDDRDIREVKADELRGYTQHHFFAGIGAWSYALRLAGWPDDRPVLTGSPPCQPFSTAGKRLGAKDERHLAPVWLELVKALRPAVLIGEQVASAIGHGWLDDLLDELEISGYTTGAAVLPACGVGAYHIRQRVWFAGRLADAKIDRINGVNGDIKIPSKKERGEHDSSSTNGRLADTNSKRHKAIQRESDSGLDLWPNNQWSCTGLESGIADSRLADTASAGTRQHQRKLPQKHWRNSEVSRLADSASNGHATANGLRAPIKSSKPQGAECIGQSEGSGHDSSAYEDETGWLNPDWLFCRDGKWRPVESGTFPLVDGTARSLVSDSDCSVAATQEARTMRLRGYGNAIVPQVAAEVIRALSFGLEGG